MLTDFQNSFIDRLNNKFLAISGCASVLCVFYSALTLLDERKDIQPVLCHLSPKVFLLEQVEEETRVMSWLTQII